MNLYNTEWDSVCSERENNVIDLFFFIRIMGAIWLDHVKVKTK